MNSGRLAILAGSLFLSSAAATHAAPATVTGPNALVLAGVVALYSPLLSGDERETAAALFVGEKDVRYAKKLTDRLAIKLTVNGETMQDASTADMIYDVPALIASLSSTLTLRPGSIILTGTPHGVGMGRNPPVWLKAGDAVAVTIEGIGVLENSCVSES